MQQTVDQALQKAIAAHNAGNLQEAERAYQAILQSEPKHPDANHNLGLIAISVNQIETALSLFKTALDINPMIEQFWLSYINALVKAKNVKAAKVAIKKAKKKGIDAKKLQALLPLTKGTDDTKVPSGKQLSSLLENYSNGRFDDAEKLAVSITHEFPNHKMGWKILAVLLGQSGRNHKAVSASQKAVALDPLDAEARVNLGIILQGLGRLDEGEEHIRQAIALKPDFAEAHTTLGIVLQDLGKLDEAQDSFIKAIELNPSISEASKNLVELLTCQTSQKDVTHPIIRTDQEIKNIGLKQNNFSAISNESVIQLLSTSVSIIKKNNLEIATDISQIYRRNSVELNCSRHMAIFNESAIIPEFCFGCYKVQVEPRSLLELIKLFLVFDKIKLFNNNTRKCMIEMRPEISGFYKGLIYCSSIKEAYQIADYLEMILQEVFEAGLHAVVKRGCSEYSLTFPDYSDINKSGKQLLTYNKAWKVIEGEYDAEHSSNTSRITSPSLSALNLSDILIIRNWIDYAKGIGDSSVLSLNQNMIYSQKFYDVANMRLARYPWREL